MRETFTEAGAENIFGREPRIVEHRLVCIDRNAVRIQHHNCLRNGVGDAAQFAILFSQLLFNLLKSVDVGLSSVPPYDVASLVPQGLDAHKKPAKYSIMAANASFHFAWLSRCQQLLSFGYDARQVLRMNCRLPSMDTRFLWRKACVIMPTLVQELCRTIRSSAPNQSGQRIDDL